MKEPNLDAIVAKFRRLVPADVPILIRWEKLEDGFKAQCISDIRQNRLLIKVAPIGEADDQWGFPIERDVEADVVHEMLHWRNELNKPKCNTAAYEAWEAQIERTAQDIIYYSRGGK